MTFLALLGSLRSGSYNKMLLNAAIELAPTDVSIEVADISRLPLYNEDVPEEHWCSEVRTLKTQVRAADAILFVSPEYNYSVPGALKNAIDWVSRPAKDNPFAGKPAAIMSTSTGLLGGTRMQHHLRQICVFVDLYVLNRPEVIVPRAAERFVDGKLIDEKTRSIVTAQLVALQTLASRLK